MKKKHEIQIVYNSQDDFFTQRNLTLEAVAFLGSFPKQLFPDALKLAERTGRTIIAKNEK